MTPQPSIVVDAENYPSIFDAFVTIECDSGAHLIGTVYPGEPVNLQEFEVPGEYTHLLVDAERGLSRLTGEDFEDFVIGDFDTMGEIAARQGDLGPAKHLLDVFFTEWKYDDDDEASVEPALSRSAVLAVFASCAVLAGIAGIAIWGKFLELSEVLK